MTVIVAAKNKSGVILAADRQTTAGSSQLENQEPKLWVADRYVVGCAGDVRTAQVLRYGMDWPTYRPKEDVDWMRFVVTRIVPEMRSTLEGRILNLDETYLGGIHVLVATRGRFAAVYDNGAVVSDRSGRTAIGSGNLEALGYLGNEGPWDASDVVTAVRRAAITDTGVSGPISVADTRSLEVVTEDG
ncbi:hypothetical protein ACFWY9_28650 [Amycolatopsis sp. NPDC059027]|uniref:hypothetical protein n=1 Tax=Amycolatopsis sp. NPDC059027 TaxID=3346709 RepID=UPI00366C44CB